MFCPRCGQEQISVEIRFCSRCGFPMQGVTELISAGGHLPMLPAGADDRESPRKRGVKQGLFIILLAILVVPLVTIIAILTRSGPVAPMFLAFLLIGGGLLRMAYAIMFEPKNPVKKTLSAEAAPAPAQSFAAPTGPTALPPQTSQPVESYVPPAGSWRAPETDDLAQPPSVTERTTKFLQDEESR